MNKNDRESLCACLSDSMKYISPSAVGLVLIRCVFCNKVLYSVFDVMCLKSLISWIPLIPHPSSLIHILIFFSKNKYFKGCFRE